MKKRRLALLLAAAMTASALGSAAIVSAAELQEAQILEIADGEEAAAADGFVPDETAPIIEEITDEGDVAVPGDAAAEDAVIGEEAGPAAETSDTEAEAAVSDEITIDSIEVASASEVAGLDAAEEEITLEGDAAVTADAEYPVTEGTGVYDADINGDVFIFTAPSAGRYKAKLNVNKSIALYRYVVDDEGNPKEEYVTSNDSYVIFSAKANEKVSLKVKCSREEYLKYRMTFEKLPAVTGITAKQTENITVVLDDRYDIADKFSVTITYENGNSHTFVNMYTVQEGGILFDEYGYVITYGIEDKDGKELNLDEVLKTPGTYYLALKVMAGDLPGGTSEVQTKIPFTVKAFDPADFPAIALDTEYEVAADTIELYGQKKDNWFTFTPPEDGEYEFSAVKNEWNYWVYTLTEDGLSQIVSNTESPVELKKGTVYLLNATPQYNTSFSFRVSRCSFSSQSTKDKLTLGVPVSGCYGGTEDADYTFTPETDGKYSFRIDATEKRRENSWVEYALCQQILEGEQITESKIGTCEDYDSVRTWDLEAGKEYHFQIYGEDRYRFTAVLTQYSPLTDLCITEKPLQKSIVRYLGTLNYDGMKVQLTYQDGTVVTAVGSGERLVDEQGKEIKGLHYEWDAYYSSYAEVCVKCEGYSDRITIPVTDPKVSEIEAIAENTETPVTIPAYTSGKVFRFTASRTGEYIAEINGRSWYVENESYGVWIDIYDEYGDETDRLTAGKTYFVCVGIGHDDDDLLPQDLPLSIYVGEADDGCRFALTSETPATCTAEGQKVYTCTRHAAHETRTEVIPKLDHVKDAGTVTVQPTCTSEGTRVYTCTLCHKELYSEKLSKADHTSDQGKVTTQPTALKEGVKTYTCTSCGKVLSTAKIAKLKATMKVTADSLKLKVGQSTKKFKVTGLAKGDYVKYWNTNDKSVVTVKGTKKGTCTIKATKKAGSATITIFLASGKTKNIKVTVQKTAVATTKITGVASKLTLKKGKSTTLKPVLSPFTSVEKITYTTSDKKIATVSSKGKIVGKKKGTATITVKAGKKSVKCKVTVK